MALTSAQREELRRALHSERDRLTRDLNRSLSETRGTTEQDRSGDTSKTPYHLADLGTDNQQMEMNAVNSTRVSNELADIEDAIERLASRPEQFGICEETGEDIPYGRLLVIPWAKTCKAAGD